MSTSDGMTTNVSEIVYDLDLHFLGYPFDCGTFRSQSVNISAEN